MNDAPADDPKKVDRHETLFVTDAEICRRLGVGTKVGYAAFQVLDSTKGSGWPPRQRLWAGKRYWPAVVDYFNRIGGLK